MPTRSLLLLLLSLALSTGCIDDLLEAPYVLATGLGEGSRQLAPTKARTFTVAGAAGVTDVDGEGRAQAIDSAPATAATAHRLFLAIVDGQGVRFGAEPERAAAAGGAAFLTRSRVALPGIIDVQAWCDDQLLLLTASQLLLLRETDSAARPWATAPPGAVAVSLGPPQADGSPCARALVLTEDRLQAVGPEGSDLLVEDLVDARAVAADQRGELWVVHGNPAVLARIRNGRAETIARHVGDVVDMHFGTGELLHPDNAYLLTAQGSLDYVRVPGGAP